MKPSDTLSFETWIQRYRISALAAMILIFLLMAAGGVVSAGGTTAACPDWPTCLGSWAPPIDHPVIYDYAHRLLTMLVLPFLLSAGWIARKRLSAEPLLTRPIFIALSLFLLQIGLGAWMAFQTNPEARSWLGMVHLILSLLAFAGILIGTAASFYPEESRKSLGFNSPFARQSLWVAGLLFLLLISGAVLRTGNAAEVCRLWPLCPGGWIPQNLDESLHLIHRGIVALNGLLIAWAFFKAWRSQRSQTVTLTAITALTVLYFAQALLGAKLVQGFPLYLLWLHQATAVAAWGVAIGLVASAGLVKRTPEEELSEARSAAGRKGLARDFLLLTKPIVVALLLVTTYAGMVIGAQAWPPLPLTFWTLLGGFLAAGGSGAINQYIDRLDDTKMQRTQKRPIPSGRLTPGEGLAFGVGIALASFYLMVAFVNFLAAMLSLAGIIYYVLLYSIFLKKTTVQNIVIGGGAGAIPPLVGWAAATGSLNIPSLFLFAIIFMWTPPHFWALALVRRKDYARAGVPMLPVVRGEKETRSQILIYTVELVALTLLLPLFGLGGSIYLIGAALLGLWLISAAWRVWKLGGNKLAWKMYRYSSMYLAFLFIVLMVDRLV